MSTCNFPTGGAAPLITPESFDREWKEKGGNRTPLAECDVNCRSPVGYEFKWSRIFEERTDATEFAESNAATPASICWHFVPVDLHDKFLDAGANLGELADLAVAILKGDIDPAQQWIDRFIVLAVIPVLSERLQEENRAASSHAHRRDRSGVPRQYRLKSRARGAPEERQ